MHRSTPRVSIEQVNAFTELALLGSFHATALKLCLSDEGLRSRILALEDHLGTSLYVKERGRRGGVCLTEAGRAFLDKAARFIDAAKALTDQPCPSDSSRAIKIVVSHCAWDSLMTTALRNFHSKFLHHSMQISACSAEQVVATLREDATASVGICALDEPAEYLMHHYWTTLDWCLIAPFDHPFLQRPSVSLEEIAREPLITFEANSVMRQHVMEAFYQSDLLPKVAMEVPSTQAAIRMVEAGLGLAIVPMSPDRSPTTGAHTGHARISDTIRKLEIAILTRPASQNDVMVRALLGSLLNQECTGTQNPGKGATDTLPAAMRESVMPAHFTTPRSKLQLAR